MNLRVFMSSMTSKHISVTWITLEPHNLLGLGYSRVLVASTAIQTIDNEMTSLVIISSLTV